MQSYREHYSGLFLPATGNNGANTELRERIAELEFAAEDENWLSLGNAGDNMEFSRSFLTTISRLARLMYLKNPLIQRGVNVKADYVFGRGVNIDARDEDVNEVVQNFLNDETNQNEFISQIARIQKERELQLDGNIFFVLIPHPLTGTVRVRSFDVDEITDIIRDPDDKTKIQYYKREWISRTVNLETGEATETRVIRFYRDWRYKEDKDRQRIGANEVVSGQYVYHIKVGGFSNWKFGVSEVYAPQAWATAYKQFLTDWSTIVAAYARFSFKATTKRGKTGVQAIKQKIATTAGISTSDHNPAPAAGSIAVMSSDDDITPIRTSGATTSAEDGRRLLLMVAASFGLPETFFGDVSVGSLATAKSLDRPTELMIANRQTLWLDIYHDILAFVLEYAVRAPQGLLRAYGDLIENEYAEEFVQFDETLDTHIDIDFPAIIEDDTATRVGAITAGAQYLPDQRLVARLILTALGENDIDETLDLLFPPDAEVPDEDETDPLADLADIAQAEIEALRESIDQFTSVLRHTPRLNGTDILHS